MFFKTTKVSALALSLLFVACATTSSKQRNPSQALTEYNCQFFAEVFRETPVDRNVAAAGTCADVFDSSLRTRIGRLSEKDANDFMKKIWEEARLRDQFDLRDSHAFWGTLIGKEGLNTALARGQEPLDYFGEKTARTWRTATLRLEKIPRGQFKVDMNTLSLVNRDLLRETTIMAVFDITGKRQIKESSPMAKTRDRVRDWIADLNRLVATSGGRLRERALFHNYLTKSLPEAEFQLVQKYSNETGMTFWELPWSREGQRMGLIRYASTAVMKAKLSELIEKTNKDIEEIRAGKSNKDPIAVAANFQWTFAAIHPMTNANGRTSRAFMNRILGEFGLPPSLRSKIDLDYGVSREEHVELVRQGVMDYLEVFAQEDSISASIYGRGFGNRLNSADLAKLAGEQIPQELLVTPRNFRKSDPDSKKFDMIPENLEQVMRLSEKDFTFGDDAFFHDQYRMPHVARRDSNGWKLYPVPPRTYAMYASGGALNSKRLVKRDLSPMAREQAQMNLKLFLAVKKGEVDFAKVRVEPFKTVQKAALQDEVYIYPWQMKLMQNALSIKEDPETNPMDVLVQNRGDNTENPRLGRTSMEVDYFNNKKTTNVSQVIEQYMISYLNYEKTRIALKSKDSGLPAEAREVLLSEIEASQVKLHRAARLLLAPYFEQLKIIGKDAKAKAYLSQHPEFSLVFEYIKRTPLAHETLQKAWETNPRDQVLLVRSASDSAVKWMGFMSDGSVRRAIYNQPRFGKFIDQLTKDTNRYLREYKEKNKIVLDPEQEYTFTEKIAQGSAPYVANSAFLTSIVRYLVKYVLIHPNEFRSIDQEAAGQFVTDFLHAQLDKGPKERLSTTVNPAYVLRPSEKNAGYDAKFSEHNPTIFMLEVPIENLVVDNTSRWVSQAEVRMKPMGRSQAKRVIQFQLKSNENDFFPLPEGPVPAEAEVALQVLGSLPTQLK